MNIGIHGDLIQVTVETGEDGYCGPDVLDDMTRRARELYRLALHDHLDELGTHVCDTA